MIDLIKSSLLLSTPSSFITALLAFILSGRNLVATLAVGTGSTVATCTTVVIIKYSQNKKLERIKLLSYDIEQFEQKKKELEKELEQKKEQLLYIRGEFSEMKGRYDVLKEEVSSLANKKVDIEKRINDIQVKNPQLEYQEELQRAIEQARLEKARIEGQITALTKQVEQLNRETRQLQIVEVELATKRSQVQQLVLELNSMSERVKEMHMKEAEVELLRITYDALFSEKQGFEDRLKELKPLVEGLEQQKQRLLEEINQIEQEYRLAEQLKENLTNQKMQIEENEALIRRQQRDQARLQGIINQQEEERAKLQVEEEALRKRIRELEEDVNRIESSAQYALEQLVKPLWINLPSAPRNIDEDDFLEKFQEYLRDKEFDFPERVIRAFHTSLKVQDISPLVILAGISGTGKSELPQQYAYFAGFEMITLAVQPRWDSPQDIQGFYNYIERKYKPTDLMRGLWQYKNDPKMLDRMVIVLLDEMNLARVEYYFSDFLSKLETRRSTETYLEIDIGSLALSEEQRKLPIPEQFLFVGTMNEDETTQSLSDKVLDRANVLTFGKPANLRLRREFHRKTTITKEYITYSNFKKWMKTPNPDSSIVQKIKHYVDLANQVMENLGHPFAHRVYQAITRYVVNYPRASDPESPEFCHALGDQFGQKLIPKLRGIMVEEAQEELDKLARLIEEINDSALQKAFKRAIDKGRAYGQFQWEGLSYKEDNENLS